MSSPYLPELSHCESAMLCGVITNGLTMQICVLWFCDSRASKECFYSSVSMMWSVECGISVKAFPLMLTKLNLHFMSRDMLHE
jgi:hypothetical protein